MAFLSHADLHQGTAAREALNKQRTQARSLILITLGSQPSDPPPKLSVSAPLGIPLLGGVTFIGRLMCEMAPDLTTSIRPSRGVSGLR